jgi:peptide-methionine (R)-S-oxide reductase
VVRNSGQREHLEQEARGTRDGVEGSVMGERV